MRLVSGLILACMVLGCAAAPFGGASLRKGELLSRAKYKDYDKATYSFEHGVRDDPDRTITRNDWDIQFGNGGDVFDVTMVTDDRSRIVDLGHYTWSELERVDVPVLDPHPAPANEPSVPVIAGHAYVVRTVDSDTDLTAVMRVESLVLGDRVTFTWRLVDIIAVWRG